MQTKEIADLILSKIQSNKVELKQMFSNQQNKISYFFLDDVLPQELSRKIHNIFPDLKDAKCQKDIREYKYKAYEMDRYDYLLENVVYAFQDLRIVQLIADICNLENIYPDKVLYAGGLSMMAKDNFLSPHLDNSHDKDRNKWRVLNLLYYVTPDWTLEKGGNLELWQNGLKNDPITILSKFNRLVVMVTHQDSWHSVSKVNVDEIRCCISNYYFADEPVLSSDAFHVTTFRGWKDEKFKDLILRADNFTRTLIRKFFKKGVRENPHQYNKE